MSNSRQGSRVKLAPAYPDLLHIVDEHRMLTWIVLQHLSKQAQCQG